MFFNDREIQEKSYKELLEICKQEREEVIEKFIKGLEEDIKKEMSKGDTDARKLANKICMQEKETIIQHFIELGFVVEFQEILTDKIPVYWFFVSWKHLI